MAPRTSALALQELLKPFPADAMTIVPVGTFVNNARNDGPRPRRAAGRERPCLVSVSEAASATSC